MSSYKKMKTSTRNRSLWLYVELFHPYILHEGWPPSSLAVLEDKDCYFPDKPSSKTRHNLDSFQIQIIRTVVHFFQKKSQPCTQISF